MTKVLNQAPDRQRPPRLRLPRRRSGQPLVSLLLWPGAAVVAAPLPGSHRLQRRAGGGTQGSGEIHRVQNQKRTRRANPIPDHRKDGRSVPGEAERTDQRHPPQPRQEQAIRADGAPHPQVHEIRRAENYETWRKEAAHQEARRPQGKPQSKQKSAP
jgi:hypothetical protein